jgi:hypothetical protein
LSYYLNSLTLIALYGLALSSIKIGLSANGWLSNRVQRVLKHIFAVCRILLEPVNSNFNFKDWFQLPAMSSDTNPIEYALHFIGCKVNQCNPQCQMTKYCWINKHNSGRMVPIPTREASSPSLNRKGFN